MKKLYFFPFLALGCFSLISCNSNNSIDNEDFSLKPETITYASYRLECRNTLLREGMNFFDGVGPTLYAGGSLYKKEIVYKVLQGDKVFYEGEPLKAGHYDFVVFPKEEKSAKLSGSFEVKKSKTTDNKKGYYTLTEKEVENTRLSLYNNIGALGEGKMPSIGNVNILVIPLTFNETGSLSSYAHYEEKELDKIEKSYFGEAKDTSWESLTSYYEKSSYGKLKIKGTVLPGYQYPLSSSEVQSQFLSGRLSTNTIVKNVLNAISKRDNINPADYDYDKDGYIDGIEVIYKTAKPYTSQTMDLWWCFTTYLTGNLPNKNKPVARRYFWSRYDQIETNYYLNKGINRSDTIDAHTLVHETGHMLGLNDYYISTGSDGTMPAGGCDMMDHNIGDHSAYSKYLLGWVTPKVIDGTESDFIVTLDSFQDTGDCLIVRNTVTDPFNDTPYDEYLMLSYITPTSVNEADSKGYGEYTGVGNGGYYSKPGLSISHIDNRLVSFEGSKVTSTGSLSNVVATYTDELKNDYEVDSLGIVTKSPSYSITSNTAAYSGEINSKGTYVNQGSSNKEIVAIASDGSGIYLKSKNAESALGLQKYLFGTSEYGCGNTYFSNHKQQTSFNNGVYWNDNSVNNWTFNVEAQTDHNITLRFLKNF